MTYLCSNIADCARLKMSKVEKNKVIWAEIVQLNNEGTWISPTISLRRKITQYKALFIGMSKNMIIIRPSYMDTHLSHALQTVMRQSRLLHISYK
jgi:hypothetical protein